MTFNRGIFTEYEPHHFHSCASDLGLRAGQWPALINVSGLGNGMHFRLASKCTDQEGDLLYVRYLQAAGCVELKIFND